MDLVMTAFCVITLLFIFFAGCGNTSKEEELLDTLLLVARNVLQFGRLAAVMRQYVLFHNLMFSAPTMPCVFPRSFPNPTAVSHRRTARGPTLTDAPPAGLANQSSRGRSRSTYLRHGEAVSRSTSTWRTRKMRASSGGHSCGATSCSTQVTSHLRGTSARRCRTCRAQCRQHRNGIRKTYGRRWHDVCVCLTWNTS